MTLDPVDASHTRMVITARYASVTDLERIVSMGMEAGLSAAMVQIDDILAGT
jgi:hypothetical protein